MFRPVVDFSLSINGNKFTCLKITAVRPLKAESQSINEKKKILKTADLKKKKKATLI